jgi:type III secretion protein J
MLTSRKLCLWATWGLLGLALGCTETIYHGLGERQANEIIVALEEQAIEAHKRRDSGGDDLWAIEVPTSARVQAWRVLQAQGLPRPQERGFGDYYPSGGLIPTSGEERVLLQYATAREIQTAILKIEGVTDAHVNLVLPERPRVPLSGQRVEPPRASVLVKFRPVDGASPVEEDAIRRLVTGGVEGLTGDNVEIIMLATQRSAAPLQTPSMTQLGPIAVASKSKLYIQIIIGLMGLVIMALAASLGVFIARSRQGETS